MTPNPEPKPHNPPCELCAGTGYYGDNGPGIKGNSEYQACECGAWSDGTRDWTEDFEHENGRYFCMCLSCGVSFSGHKRRVQCRACAQLRAARGLEPETTLQDIDVTQPTDDAMDVGNAALQDETSTQPQGGDQPCSESQSLPTSNAVPTFEPAARQCVDCEINGQVNCPDHNLTDSRPASVEELARKCADEVCAEFNRELHEQIIGSAPSQIDIPAIIQHALDAARAEEREKGELAGQRLLERYEARLKEAETKLVTLVNQK